MSTQPRMSSVSTPAVERAAFNCAFHELGLRLYWDEATFAALPQAEDARQQLCGYLQREHPHLLRAYDGGELADAILTVKRRLEQPLARTAPHALPQVNWADARWGQVGV